MNSHLHYLPLAAILSVTAAAAAPNNYDSERRVLSLTGNETVRIPATRARLTIIVEHEARRGASLRLR